LRPTDRLAVPVPLVREGIGCRVPRAGLGGQLLAACAGSGAGWRGGLCEELENMQWRRGARLSDVTGLAGPYRHLELVSASVVGERDRRRLGARDHLAVAQPLVVEDIRRRSPI